MLPFLESSFFYFMCINYIHKSSKFAPQRLLSVYNYSFWFDVLLRDTSRLILLKLSRMPLIRDISQNKQMKFGFDNLLINFSNTPISSRETYLCKNRKAQIQRPELHKFISFVPIPKSFRE